MVKVLLHGGMAERFKAAVLKTVVRKYRGFESYFLRQIRKDSLWRGDREADGARLLSECGGKTPPRVRIPPSPPIDKKAAMVRKVNLGGFLVYCTPQRRSDFTHPVRPVSWRTFTQPSFFSITVKTTP
jgi:hypothetical protein